MTDQIENIRARHSKRSEIDQSGCYRLDGYTYMGSLSQSQEDVATLLVEVDRQRAENEKLRADNERLRNEADLTREALGGWALVPPDGGADPTHERVAAVVAEVARMKKLHAPPADLPWLSREEGKP